MLNNAEKYNISGTVEGFNVKPFEAEKKRISEERKGKKTNITDLKKFKSTAIYKNDEGYFLRNGDNENIALYMSMFA